MIRETGTKKEAGVAKASNDSVAMEQAKGKIETAFDEIDNLRKGLIEFTESNQSEWTGMTADVFRQVIGAADEKLVKVGDALNTLGQNVGMAAKAYQANEEEQAQTTSKFQALLDG
jgi:WXG100 family type VII secretion target